MAAIKSIKNIYLALSITLFPLFLLAACASDPSETQKDIGQTGREQAAAEQEQGKPSEPGQIPTPEVNEENIDICQIAIPGISREYDLLLLTDTHIVLPETSTDVSQETRDYSTQRLTEFAGESDFISSDLFTAWISYVNQLHPDALLLGGDIIDSPSPSNIQFLGDSLERLEVPYLYTLGNHDWTYPWEYMTETAVNDYLPLLSPYMEGNIAIHKLELDDFTIIAVDNSSNQIHPDALQDYKTALEQGKPIILLIHVPFYTEPLLEKASSVWQQSVVLGGGIHGGVYPNDVSAEFMGMTTAKDSPVAAVIAGHVHFPDFSNLQGEKEIPQITGDAGFKGKATRIHISPGN